MAGDLCSVPSGKNGRESRTKWSVQSELDKELAQMCPACELIRLLLLRVEGLASCSQSLQGIQQECVQALIIRMQIVKG